MARLVLIGGPPGVGKSAVLGAIPRLLGRCAVLDADDAWRVHPDQPDERTRMIAERNVVAVLRGYFEAGYSPVFLSWVLANPDLVRRILDGLRGSYESVTTLYLVASKEALLKRLQSRSSGARVIEYALFKLDQIEQLPHPKIDTTNLAVEDVARLIVQRVDAEARHGS